MLASLRFPAGRIAAAILPSALVAVSALATVATVAGGQPARQILTPPPETRIVMDTARAVANTQVRESLQQQVRPTLDQQVRQPVQQPSLAVDIPLIPRATTSTTSAVRRVDLERALGASATELRVVRPAGVSPLSRADTVLLSRGDFVFHKTADTARRVGGDPGVQSEDTVVLGVTGGGRVYELPYSWLTIDSAGTVLVLRPRLEFVGGGLSYDPRERVLRGRALVGLEDMNNPTAGMQPLSRPLRLQLTLTREGEAKPTRLAIEHTSLDYTEVELWTTATDSVHVRISTGADTAGVLIPVRLYGPQLGLQLRQSVLQAFGLATTELSLTAPRGIARGDTILVQLGAEHVDVSPATVVLTPGSVATARIRSGSPGSYTIQARIDGMDAGTIPVTFIWPWSFLSAALIGVALGSLSTFVSAKRKKPWSRYPRAYVMALPFGLLTAAAATLGLDWLQLRLEGGGGWIGVVVTAALGAWAGRRVLDAATGGMSSGESDGAKPATAAI